jgi:hypothetical protein
MSAPRFREDRRVESGDGVTGGEIAAGHTLSPYGHEIKAARFCNRAPWTSRMLRIVAIPLPRNEQSESPFTTSPTTEPRNSNASRSLSSGRAKRGPVGSQ